MTALGFRGPILLMGDSITFAWSELSARPELVNRGVPGQTTGEMLARLKRQVAEVSATSLHILAGVNDIAGNAGPVTLAETRANIAAMVRSAQDGGLQVWLGAVTPVDGIFWSPAAADPARQVVELNAMLRDDAERLGATFIDYHAALAGEGGRIRPHYATDGVHLSAAGYAAITPLALRAFRLP